MAGAFAPGPSRHHGDRPGEGGRVAWTIAGWATWRQCIGQDGFPLGFAPWLAAHPWCAPDSPGNAPGRTTAGSTPRTTGRQGRKAGGRHAAPQRAAAGFTARWWTTTSTPTWTTPWTTDWTTPWATASSAPKDRGAPLPAGKRSNPCRSRDQCRVRLHDSHRFPVFRC